VATALRVVGDGGRPAATLELGTVEIAGAGVIGSYLDANGAPIPATDGAGWFRTGDLGRTDEEGFVYLAGRSDDVINRGGELVEPREVEDVLRAHAGVADAVVVGRAHPALGAEPVAFVTAAAGAAGAAGGSIDAARLARELEQACSTRLSRYKRPVEIRVLDELPAGRTGKVARRSLVERLEQEAQRDA
jgi:acyl-CoA synthetase (AMP-forming)/AMP-acid ligase II